MQNVFQIGAIALIVLFQPELRKVLEQVGRTRVSALGSVFAPTSDNETDIMHRWGRNHQCGVRCLCHHVPAEGGRPDDL